MDECNECREPFLSMTAVDTSDRMTPSLYIALCVAWRGILEGFTDWAGILGRSLSCRSGGPVVEVSAFWSDDTSCHLIVDLREPSEPSVAMVLAADYHAELPIPSPDDGSPIQCWSWTGCGAQSIDFDTISHVLRQRYRAAKGCPMRPGWEYHLDIFEGMAREQGYELANDGRMIRTVMSGGN